MVGLDLRPCPKRTWVGVYQVPLREVRERMASVVKAKYDYDSGHEDDLSFVAGQVINIIGEEGDEWYNGEYVGIDGKHHQGMFPRNFVSAVSSQHTMEPERPVGHGENETVDISRQSDPVYAQPVQSPRVAKAVMNASGTAQTSLPISTIQPQTDIRSPMKQTQSLQQVVCSKGLMIMS